MEKDFTLKIYKEYLEAIKYSRIPFYTYQDFMADTSISKKSFCLIRHDVDRKPKLSLDMAKLENKLGISSTYYFRMKPSSFNVKIIKEIEGLGHEIGYHYEVLSDTSGDFPKAFELFKKNLEKLREFCTVNTCSMHGRPFKPYDNRDLWSNSNYHSALKEELGVLGEVYLDIDYSDIAYINDTGRNWTSGKNNVRDKVYSEISADFASSNELKEYLKSPHSKLVFQVHPERWSDNSIVWFNQSLKDSLINLVKRLLSLWR
jgi:hypothetical protein